MITEAQEYNIVERVRVALPAAQEVVLATDLDNPRRRHLTVKHPAGRCGLWFDANESNEDDIVLEMVRTYYDDLAQNKYDADLARIREAFERDKAEARRKYDEMKRRLTSGGA